MTPSMTPAPLALCATSPGERLLFWSLQAWVTARMAGEPPQPVLSAALTAKTSTRVATVFVAWIETIEATRLRPIRVHCAHCGGASVDIQRLVASCAVAPVAFREGERLIEPLVREPRAIMVLGRSLNEALAQAGWPIPARLGEPDPDENPPAGPTLH